MKYFFSSSAGFYGMLSELGATNFLLSFAVDAKDCKKMIEEESVIIDSGAFSVWNKGGSIDIDEYLNFCKTLPQSWTFINLDVIPKTGSSAEDIEECCKQGYENYLYLKKHLKNVMPVYHYGDDIKWLHKFMETADYIGISPANDTHENVKREFLKQVFHVTKDKVKTHGLGYSSIDGVKLFPFYSIDSISYKSFNINKDRYLVCKQLNFYFRQSIKKFLKLEKDMQKYWEYKGIKLWNKS
jgi:hypothetical protein